MDFTAYLRCCGVAETDLPALAARITSWETLQDWMDRTQAPAIQPVPRRTSIAPGMLDRSWKKALWRRFAATKETQEPAGAAPGWERVVKYRQRVSLTLTLCSTLAVLYLSFVMLRAQRMPDTLLHLYLLIYGVMIWFLASNFFKMMLGTWHALRGAANNPWHPQHSACDPRPDIRIAVVFPVYHEDVARVAAGMAATWESLVGQQPALAGLFDFFLLSDSRRFEYWIAEEAAIHRLSETFPQGRFFYRRRPVNQNAKLGNIVDFCRRWGGSYDYMLVMDADSVMDGDAIATLLRMMEGNRRIGILQTNPTPVLRTSLFGRMQQFAARLYGSVFSYSLQAMYMGHASYIGHNAMIRLAPFIAHCILPDLSGPKPWGGKPMSHDIVESAMMARAGYEVWFLPEIEGSYEEIPANFPGFLARERRWMQGNMQHLRFLFLDRLRSVHRETFITGSMGYVAAPLWAAFLLVSAYGLFHFLKVGIMALGGIQTLALPMIMLAISSMVFLFMPRLLSLAIHIESRKAKGFGGKDKLVWSLVLETLFSFFFSPIMMICISRFLWLWLKRRSISWDAQVRGDAPLPWPLALRHFGWVMLLGVAGWAAMFWQLDQVPAEKGALLETFSGGWLKPNDLILWFFPILGGFVASGWMARVTSFSFPALKERRIFAIPEEIDTPAVIRSVQSWDARLRAELPDIDHPAEVGHYAVANPTFYVNHRRETRLKPRVAAALLPRIRAKAHLSPRELLVALGERRCFDALHVLHVRSGGADRQPA